MILFRRLVDAFLYASVPAVVFLSAAGRPVAGAAFLVIASALFCVRALFFRTEKAMRPSLAAVLLVALACFALLPRLSNLSENSMNSDELLWMHRGSRLVHLLDCGRAIEATDHLMHPGVVPAYLIGCSRSAFIGENPVLGGVLDEVSASRLPVALLGAFTCLLLFLVGRLIWGDTPAFLAGLFLALDPVHVGLSRVAHVDVALACFLALTVLTYFAGEFNGSWKWKLASGVLLGFAFLTKSPAFVLPAILVAWRFFAWIVEVVSQRARRTEPVEPQESRPLFTPVDLLALMVGYLVYVAIFPKLWGLPSALPWFEGASGTIPYRAVHAVCLLVRRAWLAEIGTAVLGLCFLLGRRRRVSRSMPWGAGWGFAALVVGLLLLFRLLPNALENTSIVMTRLAGVGFDVGSDPDHTPVRGGYETSLAYYPLLLLIRTPELLLVSCVVAGLVALRRMVSGAARDDRMLPILVTIAGFVVAMSFSRKMAMRYILPVQPLLCVLGGLGAGLVFGFVRARIPWLRKQAGAWPGLLATVVVVCAYVPAHISYFPNYYLYHNGFIGGAKGAAESFLVGWGEGYREVTRALKEYVTPDANNVSVLGQYSLVRYYWTMGKPSPTVHANIGTAVFEDADFVVTFRNELQRRRTKRMYKFAMEHEPLHVVNLQGVDIAWIYRHQREPVTKGKTYKASARYMDCETGTRLRDEILRKKVFAASRETDDPGWLMRGPRRTYGPGEYTASFRVRAETGSGTNRLGFLDVAVSNGGVQVVERGLTGSEFPSPDEYVDIVLPFELERVVSLEFRVYWEGHADLRVFGVDVEPKMPDG